MNHISETIKNKKVKSNYFKCPRCLEFQAYTFWSDEQKKMKYRCCFCFKEDFLMNLASESKNSLSTDPT